MWRKQIKTFDLWFSTTDKEVNLEEPPETSLKNSCPEKLISLEKHLLTISRAVSVDKFQNIDRIKS